MKLKKFKERNNKQIGIIIFTITCIMLVSGVILYRTFAVFEVRTNQNVIRGTVQDPGDIYFTYYVDEKIQKDMPQKNEGYILDEEKSYCGELGAKDESIKPTLNKDDWSITVSGMTTSRTKCNLYFRKYYKVKVDEQINEVSTTSSDLMIEKTGNILLCNNGITAKEEEDRIHLNDITKDSTCRFYETSTDAINNINDSKNYILFLNDESIQSTMTIPEEKEVTIDLNGHTKNGTIDNSGTLYLKSSKENKGIIQSEGVILITSNGASYTEIENIKLTNTNNHTIWANNQSYIKLEDVDLECITKNERSSGIFTSQNGKLEVINSNIEAPYGIGGHGGNILVKDSKIASTLLVGIQTNVGYDSNVVISGNTTIDAKTYGILIFQGSLELNGTVDNYPKITGQAENGIRIDYGIFNYQYGEIFGKKAIDIKGATLTRQDTTLTTENKDEMYRTFLQ